MRRILSLLCVAIALMAQQPPPAGQDVPVFRTETQLVVIQVAVKDKSGKPIEGLTKNDFVVAENGAVQNIAFLEFQKLEEIQPAPVLTERVAPIPRLAHTQIAAERPLDLKYADRRLLALYFDMTAMPPADQARAIGSAEDFVRKQMTPADLVAIMVYSGGEVNVHEDFTADRERLLATLRTLIVGEDENVPEPAVEGAFGQAGGEFAIFRTDRQLSALQTAAKMLGQLNEKKALVYFASGLRLNGTDNNAQLRATVNAASKAGVSFFTVDARGLVASAPMGDASRPSPGGVGAYTGQAALNNLTGLQRTQDTLWSLAADTGGKALLDANDLSQGIVQAQKSIVSYYVLGYYTSNDAKDGKQRRIKITLANGLNAELEYRDSYFATKEFKKFTTADRERQLEDAFMLGDPITELTMAMEVNYFQLNRAEYFVPIAIKVPGNEFALAKRGGAEHTVIDFLGEIRSGGPANQVRDKIDIKLSDATAAELATRPLTYTTGFTVLPGNYRIKFLARDLETGRIGTYETSVNIPNLNPKPDVQDSKVAISSVVLSSQRAEVDSALFNANKNKEQSQVQQTVDPLVQDGQKLLPSVTRVFNKNKPMFVYLQAYQQGAEPPQPLAAFVTFYRDNVKAFETTPVTISERVANRLNTMPIKINFPLEKLATGEYRLQVTVLNPGSQKAAFWQTQVMLVQ